MARKSVTKRIRVTKTGKVMRRAMSLGHSRANKANREMKRKKHSRSIDIPDKVIKRYIF